MRTGNKGEGAAASRKARDPSAVLDEHTQAIRKPSTKRDQRTRRAFLTGAKIPCPLYAKFARCIEWEVVAQDRTMAEMDDLSGLQDGYTAKILHADGPNGRQATWPIMNLLVSALLPDDYEIFIQEKNPANPGANACRKTGKLRRGKFLSMAASVVLRRNLRHQIATEMAAFGGRARAKALTPERRRQIAQKAAAARWAKPRESKS